MLADCRPDPGLRPEDSAEVDRLLVAVSHDQPEAFRALYHRTVDRIRNRIRRVVVDLAHSDDVTQDVYFEIWRTAHRFDPALSPGIAWMLRLAHSRAVDQVRHVETSRRRDLHHGLAAGLIERDHFAESDDRLAAAQRILPLLPHLTPVQQQALRLVYLHGHSNPAAAAALGISQAAFKSRLHDGMVALRTAVIPA